MFRRFGCWLGGVVGGFFDWLGGGSRGEVAGRELLGRLEREGRGGVPDLVGPELVAWFMDNPGVCRGLCVGSGGLVCGMVLGV